MVGLFWGGQHKLNSTLESFPYETLTSVAMNISWDINIKRHLPWIVVPLDICEKIPTQK